MSRRVGPALHLLRRTVQAELVDLAADEPVLVACSGGPDSLALAAAAAAADRPVGAVVVDHRLQVDSAVVAARTVDTCRSLGLHPVDLLVVDARESGTGPEAAARAARYAAIDRCATARGAAAVLLGHTRDDQAETVLLGLVRGSGTRSLAGMPRVRGRYRRPFLDLPRATVAAALTECDLVPWLDPHNEDPRFLRAKVRHRVLPQLEEQLGPGVSQALARTAELARADADALDGWAADVGAELGAAGWPVARVAPLPRAIRTRILRGLALAAGAPAGDLTAAHVAEIDRLVTDWQGQGPLHLPGRVVLRRECGRLVVDGTDPGSERDGAR